ncbi:protein translocase subunit SecD [Blattabacterium cuenoti]|uniref:Multifunctional fusion protein n=1 Tax=Blattabacterium cuenoti STAT TaxID=1457030 RepID=A0A224AKV1_9FLAO|nr:protein translocase subunit SecD [Blattabacterium cuenoti]BBA17449.1 bifunctional preprotein translocase subunitSecD/SecF [Blattabacterium cuenoti STAT]
MRIKNFFTIFITIILTTICLYYISYNIYSDNEKTLNLGLDLKGGTSMILDISEKDLLKKFSENSKNFIFLKALENADKKKKENPSTDYLSFFIHSFNKEIKNKRLNLSLSSPNLFGNKSNNEHIDSNSSDSEVEKFLRKKIELSIISIQNILRSRIDRFGIIQPNIQKIKNSNRILIELSGIKNVDRIKNILEKKAELHFFETYSFQEVISYFNTIKKLYGEKHNKIKKSFIDLLNFPLIKNSNSVGLVHIKYKKIISDFLNSSETINYLPYHLHNVKFFWGAKNLDNFFQLFAIKINDEETSSSLNGDMVTHAYKTFDSLNEKAIINIKMNQEGTKKWKIFTEKNVGKSIAIVLDNLVYAIPIVQSVIPNGISQIYGDFSIQESNDLINVLNTGELPTSVRIIQTDMIGPYLGKESIKKGILSFFIALFFIFIWMFFYYSIPGIYANIVLFFNIIFIFGILISINTVLTFPGIAGIILTLAMSMDANILIYEQIKENIKKNKENKLISINNSYTLQGALSSIIDGQITTLLCGIILFYFGIGPIRGFSTTLIIGILVSMFTSICLGRLFLEWHLKKYKKIFFEKKFFVLNFIQNIKYDFLSKRKWSYIISCLLIIISILSFFLKGFNLGLDFVGGRSYVILFDRKMVPEKISEILSKTFIENGKPSFPRVQTFGDENQLKIVTKYKIWEENNKTDEIILKKMFFALKTFLPINFEDFKNIKKNKSLGILSIEKIGPTVAVDITRKAFISIIISFIAIFAYVFMRFKKWQFGLGAIISLVHDSIIVLGFFSFFHEKIPILEIDQTFIASLLTIIGYSINDTVIVYDKIRKISKKTLFITKKIINQGICNSLTRTINTSLITLLVISIIFLFGGKILHSFMLSLFIGISIGTYSSIFIAPSIIYDCFNKKNIKK